MAKLAESIERVADGIVRSRGQRGELAVEIRNAAKSRRREVHSLLESLKTSRRRAGLEQAAEIKKVTGIRHGEVVSFLAAAQTSRGRASHQHRQEAVALASARRKEIRELLIQFGHELSARQQHRQELAVAQRDKAAAFMRDLTSSVAALRDGFAKEDRDRAAIIRKRLCACALDRSNALAAWHGSLHKKLTVVQSFAVSHPVTANSPVVRADAHSEPPVPPSGAATADDSPDDAAQSPIQHQTHRSGRRPFGPGGANERGGGNSK